MSSKTIKELFDAEGKHVFKATFHSDVNTSDTQFFKTEEGAQAWLDSFTE